MRKEAVCLFALAAAALLFAGGCACVSNAPTPSSEPLSKDGPALLADSGQFVAAEPKPCSPTKRAASEVRSELVYNLGGDVVANSLSITMAGGYDKPRPFERPGGVDYCCNPVPQRYFDTLEANRNKPVAIAVAPTSPVVNVPPGYRVVSSSGGVVAAPVVADEPKVAAGPGLSDAFTLTEEELRRGPEIYYPRSGQLQVKVESPVIETVPLPVETAKVEPVVVEAAPEMPKAPEADEVAAAPAPVAPAPVAPPASVAPLAPPADLMTSVAPPLPSDTVPSFPTDKYSAPGTAMGQTLPPIPTVADLDGAAEAMLSRDGADTSSLPAVELPPKLN